MSYVTLIFSDNNLNQLDYFHLINNDILSSLDWPPEYPDNQYHLFK